MLSEKLQYFENKNIITIEDIRNFRYYLNQINNDVDKDAQESDDIHISFIMSISISELIQALK